MRVEFPSFRTDLQSFDAYIREEMAAMEFVFNREAGTEDPLLTTGWDITNPNKFYYEWHAVDASRYPYVIRNLDQKPKIVIAWLSASSYVVGFVKAILEYDDRCPGFQVLVDGIRSTFGVTESKDQTLTSRIAEQGALTEREIEVVKSISPSDSKQFDFKNRYHLSDRQWEVFKLWGEGLEEREIADRLCLGVTTVKKHKKDAANKIECNPRRLREEYRNLVNDEKHSYLK